MQAKAAVLVADKTFDLREVKVPDAPPAGGGLLAVEGCGICGSDIEQFEGGAARAGMMTFPTIPGHEVLGRIAAMDAEGARRWGMKEGDRVAVHGVGPCGACQGCMHDGRCVDAFYYGFRSAEIGSGLWGGYSEVMELAPRTRLYPISEKLTVQDALLFNPFAAGYDWVVRLGEMRVGDRILVLGGGQRGLACVLAAAEAGASEIIVTGLRRDAFKLEVARKFGATHTLIVEDTDVPEAVREITHGRGVDLVVETTPLAFQPVLDAIQAVKTGGTIVLGGLKGDKPMPSLPYDQLLLKQIRLVGALSASHWAVHQAIRMVESGRFPVQLMHTHSLPLEKAARAIHLLAGEVEGESALHISLVRDRFL